MKMMNVALNDYDQALTDFNENDSPAYPKRKVKAVEVGSAQTVARWDSDSAIKIDAWARRAVERRDSDSAIDAWARHAAAANGFGDI